MREEAKLQLLQTQMWYDERNVGLGDAFLHHVGKVIERIVMYPLQFPDAYNGHRAAYVRKFPYVVTYDIAEEVIYIYAIVHTSMMESMRFPQ